MKRHWTVTQADIDAYAAATGANDPIHVDTSREGGTIAQGMMVLLKMLTLLGAGRGAIDVRFRAPVRPGERLTIVLEENELWCENEAGVRVVAGTARVTS
jgi:acyl dehydratase